MNKNLLLEIKGRSLELLAYAYEKAVLDRLQRDLIATDVECQRLGLAPKQHELRLKAVTAEALGDADEELIDAVAKDVLNNLKLADKAIGDQ